MLTWVLLALAGFAAGVINAVAGGGSLISFPALLQDYFLQRLVTQRAASAQTSTTVNRCVIRKA